MVGEKAENHDSSWVIKQESFTPDRLLHYEGLFTLGSGTLHLRGSFEESLPGETQEKRILRRPTNVTSEQHQATISHRGTYLPTIRADHPLLNSVIVNVPTPLGLEISVDGELLHGLSRSLIEQERFLDMRTASLRRMSNWETPHGKLTAVYNRFVSRVEPNLVCQTLELTAGDSPTPIRIRSSIDAGVMTNGYYHFNSIETGSNNEEISIIAHLEDSSVWVGSILRPSSQLYDMQNHTGKAPNRIWHDIEFTLQPEGSISIEKLSVIVGEKTTSEYSAKDRGTKILDAVKTRSMSELWESHRSAWTALWDQNDILLKGPLEIQRNFRFSIFTLLRSHRPGEQRFGICPKGHAGEAYFGRYFWDTEMYLLPFYIHTDPDHARDLLRFRTRTLNGSIENARRLGYHGAKIAWETGDDGVEQCPNWQYADHEIHVTADVVFAIANYVSATGDSEFLFEEALPLIIEGARFWIDRIDWIDESTPALLGVMGPDEYKPFTRNNAFTNRLVRFHLEYAAIAAVRCRAEAPEIWERLNTRLQIVKGEIEEFQSTGQKLTIPFDTKKKIIAQSEDFSGYVDVDVTRLRIAAGGRLGTGGVAAMVSQERLYRMKALKQADVVAMLFLFPNEVDPGTAARSYRYYESITTHDSSLSTSIHATVASQIGAEEEALDFFTRSLSIDVDPHHGDAEQGIHIANCGGNWQTVVFGFLGVSPVFVSEDLNLTPRLPKKFDEITLRLRWRGSLLKITATHGNTTATLKSGPPISVTVWNQQRIVYTQERWSVASE